jgi:type II secretory pathway component PulC
MGGCGRSGSKSRVLALVCLAGAVGVAQADELDVAAAAGLNVPTLRGTRASWASGDATPTELPLELLGTVVSPNEPLTWAAISNREQEDHQLVTLGSEISPGVFVVGIERLRVLLDHDGRLEELVSEEGLRPPDPTPEPVPVETPAVPAPEPQPQTESERKEARLQRIIRNPAALYSQARIRPRYEAGAMIGLELSHFKEGSTFEGMGLADGDLVIEFDGKPIASPGEGARFLQQVKMGELSEIRVLGVDGEERTLTLGSSE